MRSAGTTVKVSALPSGAAGLTLAGSNAWNQARRLGDKWTEADRYDTRSIASDFAMGAAGYFVMTRIFATFPAAILVKGKDGVRGIWKAPVLKNLGWQQYYLTLYTAFLYALTHIAYDRSMDNKELGNTGLAALHGHGLLFVQGQTMLWGLFGTELGKTRFPKGFQDWRIGVLNSLVTLAIRAAIRDSYDFVAEGGNKLDDLSQDEVLSLVQRNLSEKPAVSDKPLSRADLIPR